MSGISYILIIDELHRSICAEMGAYVCPFGPLLRSGPLQSLLAGKVQKIRIVFPATLPTRPDLYAVLLLCMVRANTPPEFFFCCPLFLSWRIASLPVYTFIHHGTNMETPTATWRAVRLFLYSFCLHKHIFWNKHCVVDLSSFVPIIVPLKPRKKTTRRMTA